MSGDIQMNGIENINKRRYENQIGDDRVRLKQKAGKSEADCQYNDRNMPFNCYCRISVSDLFFLCLWCFAAGFCLAFIIFH